MNKFKALTSLRILITVACIVSGFLAGGNIYRYIIEVPAWRHLDMSMWAEYSRHADLENGIFLFSIEAIGSVILLVSASIIILSGKSLFKTVALPVHFATFFALTGIGLTFFAAPIMLGLRKSVTDPEIIEQAFNSFHFWGLLRAVAQVLSFFGCVWAMSKLFDVPLHESGE
jgi:hypothetical protein